MFSLKSLLSAMAVLALWFSTFNGYKGAADVRAFVGAGILVMSGVAAYFHVGRQRAFWMGFFGTLLATSFRQSFALFGARLDWARPSAMGWVSSGARPIRSDLLLGINFTLIYAATFVAATVVGFLCVLIHDSATKDARRVEPPAAP